MNLIKITYIDAPYYKKDSIAQFSVDELKRTSIMWIDADYIAWVSDFTYHKLYRGCIYGFAITMKDGTKWWINCGNNKDYGMIEQFMCKPGPKIIIKHLNKKEYK